MAITINTPTAGGTVSGSQFTASGTAPANAPLYAFIGQQGGQSHPGQMTTSGPNFAFQFTNIPAGAGYNLCVMGYGNPPDQTFANGITVT